MKISFIIPVFNEAKLIPRRLQCLQTYRQQGHEVIVVDGGSSDGSLAALDGLTNISCNSASGRSLQMNHGASLATGQVLVFLHIDTVLPPASPALIEAALSKPKADWGRFDIKFSRDAMIYRVIAALINLRSALTGVCTGDQAMFVDRQSFEEIGGFAAIPLMEDVEISKRLRAKSWPIRIREPAITSSRRWEQNGIGKTIVLMWLLRLRYFLGADPRRLADIYYPGRVRAMGQKKN